LRKFGEGQYWSPRNFRLRRHATSSEMISHSERADRAFGTHVLNNRSDHVDQGSLQIVYDFSHSPYVIAGEFLKRIWEEVLRGRSQAILGVPRLDRPKLKMLTPLLSEKTNKQSDLKVSK
jgi:hypothetical protein